MFDLCRVAAILLQKNKVGPNVVYFVVVNVNEHVNENVNENGNGNENGNVYVNATCRCVPTMGFGSKIS